MSEQGTPEWMRSMIQQTTEEAITELDEIVKQAVKNHGIPFSDKSTIMGLLIEVQNQSFHLGAIKGIHLVLDAMGRRKR